MEAVEAVQEITTLRGLTQQARSKAMAQGYQLVAEVISASGGQDASHITNEVSALGISRQQLQQ